jgi:ubiquinone/menaquinone biosynthesis C-methylase UbiE
MFEESYLTKSGEAIALAERYSQKDHFVLDVGCGNGIFLNSLSKDGRHNLYGIDREDFGNASKEYFLSKVDISNENLPFKNNSFDLVTTWQVFEHLENPHHATREIYRVLRSGGIFIVSIPNPFHLMSRLLFLKNGNMPRWTKKNNHITVYTKDLLYKLFLKDRFDVVDTKYPLGEFTYGPFKLFDGYYPENEWFGHFLIFILKKK